MSEPEATSTEVQLLGEFRRRHQTATLTLLFSDLVDSTRYKQEHGDLAGTDIIREHIAEARRLLAQFPRAQEIGTQGDSFFAAFASPSEGVLFALRFQAMMSSDFGARGLRARVGLHLGEVIVTRGEEAESKVPDLLGLQVDVAARICALAVGGQVLCSRPVFDNARQFLRDGETGLGPLSWSSKGPRVLKGVVDPVEVCEVKIGGEADPNDTEVVPTPEKTRARLLVEDFLPVILRVFLIALVLMGVGQHRAAPPKPLWKKERPPFAKRELSAIVKPPFVAAAVGAPAAIDAPSSSVGAPVEAGGELASRLVAHPSGVHLDLGKFVPNGVGIPQARVDIPAAPPLAMPSLGTPPSAAPTPAAATSAAAAPAAPTPTAPTPAPPNPVRAVSHARVPEISSMGLNAESSVEEWVGKLRLPSVAELQSRLSNDTRAAVKDAVSRVAKRFLSKSPVVAQAPVKVDGGVARDVDGVVRDEAVAKRLLSESPVIAEAPVKVDGGQVSASRTPLWSIKGDGVVAWDVDGDGRDEAVVSSGRTLRLVGADGRDLWKRRFGDAVHVGVMAGTEVVATVRYGTGFRIIFLDGKGGLVREAIVPWPSAFPGRPDRRYGVSAREVYDHDKDGRMDVALSVSSLAEGGPVGVLIVDGSTGKVLAWKPTEGFPRDVVLVDADGNGRVEPFAVLDPAGAVVPISSPEAKVDSAMRKVVEEALLRKGRAGRLRFTEGAAILATGDGIVRAYRGPKD